MLQGTAHSIVTSSAPTRTMLSALLFLSPARVSRLEPTPAGTGAGPKAALAPLAVHSGTPGREIHKETTALTQIRAHTGRTLTPAHSLLAVTGVHGCTRL